LVSSLRGVIAKQSAEIETLRNKLKELTTTTPGAVGATTTSEASQPTAKFTEVRYVFFCYFIYVFLSLSPFHLGGYGDMKLYRDHE
jgi:hypothetical protein